MVVADGPTAGAGIGGSGAGVGAAGVGGAGVGADTGGPAAGELGAGEMGVGERGAGEPGVRDRSTSICARIMWASASTCGRSTAAAGAAELWPPKLRIRNPTDPAVTIMITPAIPKSRNITKPTPCPAPTIPGRISISNPSRIEQVPQNSPRDDV